MPHTIDEKTLADEYGVNTLLGVQVAQAVFQRLQELGVPFDDLPKRERAHFMRETWGAAQSFFEIAQAESNPGLLVERRNSAANRVHLDHLKPEILQHYCEGMKLGDATARLAFKIQHEKANGAIEEFNLSQIDQSLIAETRRVAFGVAMKHADIEDNMPSTSVER